MMKITEKQATLDFRCCACDHSVSVTVKCAGPGLFAQARPLASVHVPCPTCGSVNQVVFEPSGTVHRVAPASRWCIPEPSIN